jgi:hypothetical protein
MEVNTHRQSPIIITIKNISGYDIDNVVVFGQNDSLKEYFNIHGDLITDKVSIKSDVPDKAYKYIIDTIKHYPFRFGQIYIQSTSIEQLEETIVFSTVSIKPIDLLSPHSHVKTIVLVEEIDMLFDGEKSMTISKLLKEEQMQFRFYPLQNINLARTIGGSPTTE